MYDRHWTWRCQETNCLCYKADEKIVVAGHAGYYNTVSEKNPALPGELKAEKSHDLR